MTYFSNSLTARSLLKALQELPEADLDLPVAIESNEHAAELMDVVFKSESEEHGWFVLLTPGDQAFELKVQEED